MKAAPIRDRAQLTRRVALWVATAGSALLGVVGLLLAPAALAVVVARIASHEADAGELLAVAALAPVASFVLVALGALGLLGARGVRRGERRWIWGWIAAGALIALFHPLATLLGALLITGFAQALCALPTRRSAAPAAP